MDHLEPAVPDSLDPSTLDTQFKQGESSAIQPIRHTGPLPVTDLSDPLESNTPSSDPAEDDMVFPSSPVLYPPSSSPAPQPESKKRKLFQPFPSAPTSKKTKLVAGFEIDEDDPLEPEWLDGKASIPGPSEEAVEAPQSGLPSRSPHSLDDIDGVDFPKTTTQSHSPTLLPLPRPLLRRLPAKTLSLSTTSGETLQIPVRPKAPVQTYESLIASRSTTKEGRAKKSYYGIEIHKLVNDAHLQRQIDENQREVERRKAIDQPPSRPTSSHSNTNTATNNHGKNNRHQLWTEKYRARKFTELVGDERTHRHVLKWLKAWDEIVFPGTRRLKQQPKKIYDDDPDRDRQHRKILLLTGPPGLGKTTLAHVCARQAGYEALEINASDDRSRDVVRGRIKDALATETVRGVKEHGKERRVGRPVCVIVDEVDGVVTGSGGSGEGGFMKALVDLVQLDQRNTSQVGKNDGMDAEGTRTKTKKGDKFRMLRPLILVCNDVYAPSLRPLRTSSLAEIVHVRKPALDKVMTRLKAVFESERVACDNDAVRRICESSWGMGTRKQNSLGVRGAGEGDIRGILVHAEWIAHKFRSTSSDTRLTRKWVETHLGESQASSGGSQKGMGRGGVREVVDRVFSEGAGMPNLPTTLSAEDARLLSESKTTALGVADLRKRAAISSLREMIDMCGEHDRVMTDCFAAYPLQVYQDDVQLSKPSAGYDWLHFHDCLSSRIFGGQEWELNPYLSTGACGFHHLFATVDKGDKTLWSDEKKQKEGEDGEAEAEMHPFSGLKADFVAHEAERANYTLLTELQGRFQAPLLRMFSSVDNIATELMPSVGRMLAPDVKPVIVGGSGNTASVASVRRDSEKKCISTAVRVMSALDVRFDKVKIEIEGGGAHSKGGFAYRMDPPLDTLTAFHLEKGTTSVAPVRYAVRQVLDQELRKEKILQASMARQARSSAFAYNGDEDKENETQKGPQSTTKTDYILAQAAKVKRDFFGRIVNEARPTSTGTNAQQGKPTADGAAAAEQGVTGRGRVWVSFHEGFSNAVRKPITLKELLETF